jgi:O-antigen/teichoic acid export membrane protein
MGFRARSRGVNDVPAHTEPALTRGDIRSRAASGAVLLTGKGIFGMALGLLSVIVVTRLLVPSELGLYAIAVTVSSFLPVLSGGVGMAGALIRRPVAPDLADLRAYVALQLVVTGLLATLVALVALPFGVVGELIAVMVASVPILAFRGAGLVVLERQLLYKRIATAETAETIVYYAWTIITVIIGWGLWGLATATVARTIVGTVCIVALSPTGFVGPRFDRRRIRSIVGIGLRVQAVDVINSLRDQVLVLGAAAVGSVSIVAYWGLVLRALQAPGLLLWSLVRVSFPAMSRTRSAGGDPGAMLPRLLPAATVLAGLLLSPLAGSAPALVPFLFGQRWSPAAGALSLACLAVVIHTPLLIAGQTYLWTSGDAKTPLHAMIADAVVCVALGLPLVPIIGVTALALAGVVAAVVHTVILARAIDREVHVHVFRHIRSPVLSWIVAAAAAWGCAQAPGPLFLRAAVSSCVGLGLYVGLLLLTRRELVLGLAREYGPWVRGRLLRSGASPATIGTQP